MSPLSPPTVKHAEHEKSILSTQDKLEEIKMEKQKPPLTFENKKKECMTKFCGLKLSWLSLATLVLRGHYNCCSLPYGEENESETRDEYVKSIRIHVNKTPNNLKLTSSCLVL